MKTVAFMGLKDPSAREIELLDCLGALLHLGGYELHTSPARGANAEVARGYLAASGRQAKFHTQKLHRHAQRVLIYGQDVMLSIDALKPSPVADDWHYIANEAELETFCESTLGLLAQDGRL
jgi:hypothetical protein